MSSTSYRIRLVHLHGSNACTTPGMAQPTPVVLKYGAGDVKFQGAGGGWSRIMGSENPIAETAARIFAAVGLVLTERRALTPDLGGAAGTGEMADAIVA